MGRRTLGMGILRIIAVLGGLSILFIVVVTAGTAFLPGSKMGRMFNASADSLAGGPEVLVREAAGDAGGDGGADAGTVAAEGPSR